MLASRTLHACLTDIPKRQSQSPFLICTAALRVHGEAFRALLNNSYAHGQGRVVEPAAWIEAVTHDPEFEAEFCLAALEPDSNAIIGFIQAWSTGFVKELAVDGSQRRRGVGHALVSELATRVRAKGLQHLSLKVVSSNEGAIRFYRRLGFADGAIEKPRLG